MDDICKGCEFADRGYDPDIQDQFSCSDCACYREAYIRAFGRMMEERERRGKTENGMRWGHSGVDVFHWWMEDGVIPGQEVLDGFEEI